MQHFVEVYWREFEILRFFLDADLSSVVKRECRSTRVAHSENTDRTPSEEDGQLPQATEYFGAEIIIYSFQSWNFVEETETRV
jgi:hypothetical protein